MQGYYVYGKFNQFSGNVPYAAFIQALKQLMQQLLSESEEKLAHWRDLLQSAVGKNGQVVIDVIPEFELVVGMPPSLLPTPLRIP
jgi:predicted ATPase